MKIFVMGMQAAGKTVFVSHLYYYARKNYGQKAIKGKRLDCETYMAGILDTLNRPAWPESTKEGHVKIMEFTINMPGISGEFNLVDAAGQDMENSFLLDEESQLTATQKKIKAMITGSDMLIFLFDLDSVSKLNTEHKKTESWWIFNKFCGFCKGKKGLVVLSKADQFEALSSLSEKDMGDTQIIRSFISSQIEDFGQYCSPENLDGLAFCAVSSVATETALVDNNPMRKPKLPLVSRGLENVFDALQKKADYKRNAKCIGVCLAMIAGGTILGEGIGGGIAGVVGGVIGGGISFALLFWSGEFNLRS